MFTIIAAMSNIDFTQWVTQQALANDLGVSIQRVHNWTRRGKIEKKAFPELNGQVLVNKTTLNIKTIK
ncbi:MAG TPA: hypothetical protein PLN38_16865 [Chitinophagales bacterium]|nr:hypothetical protein [Chitinophagales bacterium]